MAKAYSDDLRRKLLESHERGKGTLEELAERFGVSLGYAKKISAALRQTGRMERPPGRRRGRTSRVTPAVLERLRAWLRERPDLTLAELQRELQEAVGCSVSVARLWVVLRDLELRLKKNSTPRNRTPRRISSGGRHGGRR